MAAVEQQLQSVCFHESIFDHIVHNHFWLATFMVTLLVLISLLFLRTLRDKQRKEKLLEQKEERLRLALDGSQDGFWDWTVETGENIVDSRWCSMLGYHPDEIEPTFKQWERLVHPEDLPVVEKTLQRCINNEISHFVTEFRMKMKDGDWKWVSSRGMVVVRDSQQRPRRVAGTHRDISRQKEAELSLKKALHTAESERNKVDAILKSIGDGLIVTDQSNRIVLLNQAAKALLNIDDFQEQEPDITQTIEDTQFAHELAEVLNGNKENASIDFEIYDASHQQTRTIQARVSPIYDNQHRPSSVLTTLQDVSRIREMARLKSEFISTAAHELRTPLTAIMGFADLLLDNNDYPADTRREYLKIITDRSEALSTIVDELLDLSRIEAGRIITLDLQQQQLSTIVQPFINQYRDSCPTHHIVTDFNDLETTLCIDKNKLTQAVENILSNAIKYSPQGGEITITTHKTATDFIVTISDQGIGMTPTQLERIFDKFYRADNTNTAVGGLGIGMSIVKNIIESHHGTIRVDSEFGVGSHVHIILPLPTDHDHCDF